jgi:tetratricopeptide (TPR) repeat protein
VKQEAITMPAAAIVLVWLAWPRDVPSRQRWIATAIFVSAMLAILAFQFRPIEQVSATTQGNEVLVSAGFEPTLPLSQYFLTSIKEYSGYYLWRFFLPVRLSVDPDAATITTPLSVGFLISSVFLFGLTLLAFWCRHRRPLLAVGLGLLLVSPLSAYCLFPLADIVAEHRAYISSLGAVIILADLLVQTRPVWLMPLVLLTVYGWLTTGRNAIWNNETILWEDASSKAPNKIRPHMNLGALYQVQGQTNRAIKEYEYVLAHNPDHPAALGNLGSLYLASNDLARAEQVLSQAAARQSAFPGVYLNLAVLRLRQGKFEEARELLLHTGRLNSYQLMVHHNLGDILFNEGQPAKAIDEYLAELKLNPDSALTHLHLAKSYETVGLRDKAIDQYRIASRLDPANREARAALQGLKE